jgi:hypothetical protein
MFRVGRPLPVLQLSVGLAGAVFTGKETQMGMDPSAIVFYGYCWNEEKQLLPVGEYEWQVCILKQRGIHNPWQAGIAPYSNNRTAWDEWNKAHESEITAYREQRKAVELEFPVDIGRHGHCETTCSHICIKSSRFSAAAGWGSSFDPAPMAKENTEWDAAINAFLSELGIEKPDGQDKPQWWLVAYYG